MPSSNRVKIKWNLFMLESFYLVLLYCGTFGSNKLTSGEYGPGYKMEFVECFLNSII